MSGGADRSGDREGSPDRGGIDVIADRDRAHTGGQDETHLPLAHLLVRLQGGQHRPRIKGRPVHGQSGGGDQTALAVLIRLAPEPHRHGDVAGRQHAQTHGLAVQPGAVAAEVLDRMAQGVCP